MMKKKKQTNQLNLRMSEQIFADLDFIGKYNSIKGTDWLKVNMAKLIRAEKEDILNMLDRSYTNGRIDEHKYEELTGRPPSNTLVANRMSINNGAKNYIRETLIKLDQGGGKGESKR